MHSTYEHNSPQPLTHFRNLGLTQCPISGRMVVIDPVGHVGSVLPGTAVCYAQTECGSVEMQMQPVVMQIQSSHSSRYLLLIGCLPEVRNLHVA